MNGTTRYALALLTFACLPFCSCASAPRRVWQDAAGTAHEPLKPNAAAATVLVFITLECPIANGYAPEISRIANDYGHRNVRFFAVHADPTVQPGAARRHAMDYGYTFPVLLDPEQTLVRQVGATVTPEAAVLDRQGKVVYLGRIDDLYYDYGKRRHDATQHDLRDAIDAVLSGEKIEVARMPSLGCEIMLHSNGEP